MSDIQKNGHAEGYAAASFADCPYISGQRILGHWHDGFVARCIDTGNTPPDTPLYLQGRIAYLNGTPCSEIPEGQFATGPWMSGWLIQRAKTPIQPNKREGDTLLDAIFGESE